ncbi:MAG: hypothetical protein ABIP65_10875 [Vicinamibacterales bacterium]
MIDGNDVNGVAGGIRAMMEVELPRAGHLSNLEAPREFSQALVDFLGSPL